MKKSEFKSLNPRQTEKPPIYVKLRKWAVLLFGKNTRKMHKKQCIFIKAGHEFALQKNNRGIGVPLLLSQNMLWLQTLLPEPLLVKYTMPVYKYQEPPGIISAALCYEAFCFT